MRCFRNSMPSSADGRALALAVALALVAVTGGRVVAASPSPDGDESRRRAADLTEAVREHLERSHQGEWARFDLIDVRWTNGEPSPTAWLGPLTGDVDPTVNGSIILYAEVHEERSPLARLPVSISVRPWVRVPVAARALTRGEPILAADVHDEERPLADLHGASPVDPNTPDGLQARRNLRPGDPLTLASVEIPPLVISGRRVVIRFKTRGIELRAAGIARKSGRRGDTIQVVNLDSRRTLEARVSGPGAVEVEP